MRVDTFLQYDDDLLRLIKKSGCSVITFGVESGSDRMLKLINKDIVMEQVYRANQRALSFGFKINYHFMVGFPEETKEDVIETIKAIRILTENKRVNIYGPSIYTPYPMTPLFDRCCELGFVPPQRLEDWIQYDWDIDSMLPWFDKKYKSFLNEVQSSCKAANYYNRNGILPFLIGSYGRLKLAIMVRGIRLFEIDTKLMKLSRKIMAKVVNMSK
jgi:hypothetical protein